MTNNRHIAYMRYVMALILDDNHKKIVSPVLAKLPPAFFLAPASSSGKFHPDYALGEGGLVRHSIVAIHIARDLGSAFGFTPFHTDVVTFALAVHDGLKGGPDLTATSWDHTDYKGHATNAGDFILNHSPDLPTRAESEFMYEASSAVDFHMSMWGADFVKGPISDMPGKIEQVVSIADYMASRKYLVPSAELAEILEEF